MECNAPIEDTNSPKTYYLMAHIGDEMAKYEEVKQLLKKAIYLDLVGCDQNLMFNLINVLPAHIRV